MTLMESSSVPRCVVDASVATKWHLRDEDDVASADALLTEFEYGRIELIAPLQIRYEVPNAIRVALRTGRLTVDQARTAIDQFLGLNLTFIDENALIQAAFDLSVTVGCSLYDGLYLALAEEIGCPFVYADRRLFNVLGGRFRLAVWINDFVQRRP